jgi:hypothetical protein
MGFLLLAFSVALGLIILYVWWRFLRVVNIQIPWHIPSGAASVLDEARSKRLPVDLYLTVDLPEKLYLEDSCIVVLEGDASAQTNDVVVLPLPTGVDVQIELKAAAFDVDGARSQRKYIPQLGGSVSFRWSITPKKSGIHVIILEASWIDEDGVAHEIGVIRHRIRVLEFLGRTARQLRLIGALAATLNIAIAIAGLAIKLLEWLLS